MSLDNFGELKSPTMLEQAVVDTLALWFPTYLGELEEQYEIPTGKLIARQPKHYRRLSEFENWPEVTPPVVAVISPGLYDDPGKDGKGRVDARWSIIVASIIAAANRRDVRNLAMLYATAVRSIILQHRSLGGVASGAAWLDESYDDMPGRKSRTLMATQSIFWIEMDDIVSVQSGPHLPEPPGDDGFPYTATDVKAIPEMEDEE